MIKEYVADEFQDDINKDAVLVDFYSKTCGPCKMLSFILKDLDKTYGDRLQIVKVPFEENPERVAEYGVEGYPTVIMMKNGKEQERKAGLQQKPVLVKMIEAAL